jgi:hypothetical protein
VLLLSSQHVYGREALCGSNPVNRTSGISLGASAYARPPHFSLLTRAIDNPSVEAQPSALT